jgi:hypothetical protein
MNTQTIADDDADYSSWIELYNASTEPVNLLNYGLSNDTANPYKFTFGNLTLAPGEYKTVWASNKNRPGGAPGTLIQQGSVWKYLDNGTNQDSVWLLPNFNDSAWASGPPELGYGDNNEATGTYFWP